MKANVTYTAVELLSIAGFDKPESLFGKGRLSIGGIRGVNEPDRLIKIGAGVTEVEVIVGDEKRMIQVDEVLDEPAVTKLARKRLDEDMPEGTEPEAEDTGDEVEPVDSPEA